MTGRCLSGLYNNRNGIKIEFIQDAGNKNILLKIIKIKKVIKGLKLVKKIKVIKETRNIKECLIRSFAFYYNNIY